MELASVMKADISNGSYRFFDSAIGSPLNRNHVVSFEDIPSLQFSEDSFLSMCRFKREYLDHVRKTGSVSGTAQLPCYSDFVWFDVDNSDLSAALIDVRQLLANLDRISPALSRHAVIYFSGSKGFHIGIPTRLFALEPSADLPAKVRRIALAIAGDVPIDTHIYDKNRLWRVPNTINGKSGLYKGPLTFEELATWSVQRISEKAKSPHGQAQPVLTYEGQYQPIPALVELAARVSEPGDRSGHELVTGNGPGWIAEALADLAPGNRNSTFARIAGRLSRDGWLEQDIVSLLTPHAERVGFPPAELESEVHGLCSRYPSATTFPISHSIYMEKSETESSGLKPVSLRDLLSREQGEIRWLVEALFPAEGVGIIGGTAGVGKSWLLWDLAIECARGGLWLGRFKTTKCKVLYIDEESSASLASSRLKKLLAAKELSDDLDIQLVIGQGVCLSSGVSVEQLSALLELYRPNLVILDSLIRLHRADENSATDMARVFSVVKELVRKYNCLIVFADHHRKPGMHDGSADASLRGSSEKVAFVDSLLSLKKDRDGILVEHSKSRFAQAVEPFVVRLEEPIKGLVWVQCVGDHETLRNATQTAKTTEFLKVAIRSNEWTAGKFLADQASQQGISPKIVAQVLKSLAERGEVEREDRKPEVGRGGKKAWYRRRTTPFLVSPRIGTGKSETETSEQGAV